MIGNAMRRWMTFVRAAAASCVIAAVSALPLAGAEAAEIRRSLSAEPDTLDPHTAGMKASWAVLRDLYEGLTRADADGQPVPGAAESWTVSDDGLNYTFNLRPGLVWSDGTALTADDFVAGLQRLFDPATASKSAFMLFVIENARDIVAGTKPPDALGVKAEDADTLTIRLEHPSPKLPVLLSAPFAAPAPRAYKSTLWPTGESQAFNGAYRLDEWVPNSHIRLAKNARYIRADEVAADQVSYVPITDEGTALWRLRADELDLVSWFSLPQMRWLQDNMPQAVHTEPALFVTYLVFNTQSEPFNDSAVRRAVSLAIDRSILTDKVLKMGDMPTEYFVPAGVTDYLSSPLPQEEWTMDRRRAEAKALLAEAGYGPDKPLAFTFRTRAGDDERRIAITLVQMWKQVGIDAKIHSTDLSSHYGDIEQGNFELADAGWSVFDAPELFLDLLRSDTGALNYGRYANPEFDALLKEGLDTADIGERHALFAAAENLMLSEQAVAPLYFNVSRYVVSGSLGGFVDNPADIHLSQYLIPRAD